MAEKIEGTVICGDSLQIYEDLPTLTAQPPEEDKKRVPHKLYGILQTGMENSVGSWLKRLEPVLRAVKNPIVVGGSGMYLSALIDGTSEIPEIPQSIRTKARRTDIEVVKRALKNFPLKDPQRLYRAYEVYLATGKPISYFKEQPAKKIYTGKIDKIWINPPREKLYERINLRFLKMLNGGVIEEVKAFKGNSIAIGLKEIRAHIEGKLEKEEMIRLIQTATRQYAKRQLTWCRNQIEWDKIIEDPF